MKTHHLLLIIVLVAGLAGVVGWYLGSANPLETASEPSTPTATSTPLVQIPVPNADPAIPLPSLDGLTLTVPETATTVLINTSEDPTQDGQEGVSTYSATFGANQEGFVALVENRLTALNETTFVIPFAVSHNGSGTFSYLGLLSTQNDTLTHMDSYLLGDRIRILDVSADRDTGLTTITILDRHADQAMADDPNHQVTIMVEQSDNRLTLRQHFQNVEMTEVSVSAVAEKDRVALSGFAPESWFFESDFPVELLDADQEVRASGFVTRTTPLDMDNPSTQPISFTGELDSVTLEDGEDYYLRLHRDNASEDRSLDAFAIIAI